MASQHTEQQKVKNKSYRKGAEDRRVFDHGLHRLRGLTIFQILPILVRNYAALRQIKKILWDINKIKIYNYETVR